MTRKAFAVAISVGLLVAVGGWKTFGADAKGVGARSAFARLKGLAGDWKAREVMEGHPAQEGTVTYRVTSGGSVVMETLFAGTGHEMVSMYHLDGDDLRLTHYCAAQNQPHLKLDRAASTPDALVFAFDGGTNFDPSKDFHMHSGRIVFRGAGRVESEWDGYKGREKMHTAKFVLTRP